MDPALCRALVRYTLLEDGQLRVSILGESRAVGRAIDLLNHVIDPDKRSAHGEDAPYSHVCISMRPKRDKYLSLYVSHLVVAEVGNSVGP